MNTIKTAGINQSETTRLYTPQFILVWIANFFVVSSMACFFLFPLFITNHEGNKSDIGILMAAMGVSAVIVRPWISQMIDSLGRKKSYIYGSAFLVGMPFFYLLLQGNLSDFFVSLFVIRIVHGLGLAMAFTASFAYVADIIPQERLNEGMAMFGITALVGMAVGPVIAEPVIRHLGFDAYFLTISAIGAISLILLLFLPETYAPRSMEESTETFFSVLKRRKILGVAVLTMLFGVGMATQAGFVSPYVEQLGLPNISFFFIAYSTAAVLTRIFGSRLADRVGEERIIPWFFIVNGIGFLSLIFVRDSWLLVVSGFVTGLGHGFVFPCLNALAFRNEPVHIRGKIAGISTGGMDSGMLMGSLILGYVGDWFGYRPLFFTTFLILLSACGLFFVLLPKKVRSNHRYSRISLLR